MTGKSLSVEEIIASLEAQAAVHREREAFFAAQEKLYREQRERHAAELATITRRLEAFRDSAEAAAELAARPAESTAEAESFGPASKPQLARMVRKVVSGLGPDRVFGARWVAGEINGRFGSSLHKPVAVRQASAVLRRMHRLGELELRRSGAAHLEARYALRKT